MRVVFTIHKRLPLANDFKTANRYAQNRTKKEWRDVVQKEFSLQADKNPNWARIKYPLWVTIVDCRSTSREQARDASNLIFTADKLIIDALVNMGVIKNDSPEYVAQYLAESRKSDESRTIVVLDDADEVPAIVAKFFQPKTPARAGEE